MPSTLKMSASLALSLICGAACAKGVADHGVSFDSAGVLDLSNRTLTLAGGTPISFAALDSAMATAIADEKTIDEQTPLALPFSEDQFGCDGGKPACLKAHEAQLIAQTDGVVKRLDKRLVVAAGAGNPAVFVDWTLPETKHAEGDGEEHWYLGRLAGSGYHRVEVRFQHDAPGNFLIDPKSGKIAFVHNGADIAVFSPDGRLLLTFNTLNPPLSLRVAALEPGGARLVLVCTAKAGDERTSAQFKGWRDANSFDLLLEPGRVAALRATRGATGWSVASSDVAARVACTAN